MTRQNVDPIMRTHQEIDARSLAMHCLIAKRIRARPDLFETVKTNLAHFKRVVSPRAQPYVLAWERLAEAGLEACLAVATEDSERGRAMRQSSPFGGILPHQERFAFLRQWKQDNEARISGAPDPGIRGNLG